MRTGPFAQPDFVASEENFEALGEMRVLIVGAGGLGCELLKNMALSGFKDIFLIDLDTIDVSNLNRQFLFRSGDEGKSKAEVAAARVMEVVPDCKITWFNRPIQDFGTEWYRQFYCVVAGLDNQAARKWLNRTLCDLVKFDAEGNPIKESIIPLIDGGTEGLMGQARIFFPHITSCFECQLYADAGGAEVHLCTVAVNPRVPEHCAMYAMLVMWPQLVELNSATDYKMWEGDGKNPHSVKRDNDNGHHMTWLYNRATEWAEQHEIKGLTYALTQQVVKNIIPAVAATNAIVAASCVNEVLKFISYCNHNVQTYFQYNGRSTGLGTYSRTFDYRRLPNGECEACTKPLIVNLPAGSTGQHFLDEMKSRGHEITMITFQGQVVYTRSNPRNFLGSLEGLVFTLDEEEGVFPGEMLSCIDRSNTSHKVFTNLTK
jgi:ubiquitin-activating enzyme E1 C